MLHDPIVDEIHGFREQIAREHGNDIRAYFRTLQREERSSGVKLVTLPPPAGRNASRAESADDTGGPTPPPPTRP